MNLSIDKVCARISMLQHSNKIELLDKGFSPDKKYLITSNDYKYILRISDINDYEKKRAEFSILKDLQQYQVFSHRAIEIGVIVDLGVCYTVYSYLDGVDGIEALPNLTEKEQYKLGLKAGKELFKMNLYPAPPTINSWHERAMKKHYRYLESYKNCGIKIKNDEKIIGFIERNKHFLINRPNRFQHDDFHLGNIIVKNNDYAGVIDFNNYDWGDPYHDFVKVALITRGISIPFSIGQLNGYFDDSIPDDFWMLYSIYAAMVVFSTVVWSIKFSPQQSEAMIERLYAMLEDHQYFAISRPTWYSNLMPK
jgi:aminoglycoside phosphotransferase (APT) family kinase protein